MRIKVLGIKHTLPFQSSLITWLIWKCDGYISSASSSGRSEPLSFRESDVCCQQDPAVNLMPSHFNRICVAQLSVLLGFVSSGALLNEQHFSHKSQTSIHSQNCWGPRKCLLPLSYAYRHKNVLLLSQCCYSPEKVHCSCGRHNTCITHKTSSYSRNMIKNNIKNN